MKEEARSCVVYVRYYYYYLVRLFRGGFVRLLLLLLCSAARQSASLVAVWNLNLFKFHSRSELDVSAGSSSFVSGILVIYRIYFVYTSEGEILWDG